MAEVLLAGEASLHCKVQQLRQATKAGGVCTKAGTRPAEFVPRKQASGSGYGGVGGATSFT